MRFIQTLRTGLLGGFEAVFGAKGRQVTLPQFVKPKLILRGHEAFCRATGWRLTRWDWELIRVKVGASIVIVQRDPVQVVLGAIQTGQHMLIAVPGYDDPARYAAGLHEFNLAFGSNVTEEAWRELWRRTGETSLLLEMQGSQLNHGEIAKT